MRRILQQELLNAVFCNVFEREFNAESLDDRVMLQKAVFSMREKGVSCGDYEFVWDQYGPFSPELSDDMKKQLSEGNAPIEFTPEAQMVMAELKKIFLKKSEYPIRYWVETIASLLYLKRYMYPSYSDEEIIAKLEMRKDSLSNHQENIKAMESLKEIFVM